MQKLYIILFSILIGCTLGPVDPNPEENSKWRGIGMFTVCRSFTIDGAFCIYCDGEYSAGLECDFEKARIDKEKVYKGE